MRRAFGLFSPALFGSRLTGPVPTPKKAGKRDAAHLGSDPGFSSPAGGHVAPFSLNPAAHKRARLDSPDQPVGVTKHGFQAMLEAVKKTRARLERTNNMLEGMEDQIEELLAGNGDE